jgi:HK97 family phage major capsid protein
MTTPAMLNSGTLSEGGALVPDFLLRQEVDRIVLGTPTFLSLATTFPTTQRVVKLSKIISAPKFQWIGEAETKPRTDISFDRDTMTVHEIAGIVVFSERLDAESISQPGVRQLVAETIGQAAATQIDEALYSGNSSTVEPSRIQGLLNQTGWQRVDFGDSGNNGDVGEDCRLALRAIRTKGYQPTAFAMNPVALDALLSIRASTDLLKYPEVLQGRLWGIPITIAPGIPAGAPDGNGKQATDIILADWNKILCATGSTDLRISDSATVDSVSLWQTDRVGVRWVGNISSPLMRRPDAVCVIKDVLA